MCWNLSSLNFIDMCVCVCESVSQCKLSVLTLSLLLFFPYPCTTPGRLYHTTDMIIYLGRNNVHSSVFMSLCARLHHGVSQLEPGTKRMEDLTEDIHLFQRKRQQRRSPSDTWQELEVCQSTPASRSRASFFGANPVVSS